MSSIKLKKLTFSNLFSYGQDNVIHFDKNRMTQLTAPNGSGKSSIALILQETLFNKNIKGIKKNDLLNRWSKSKTWDSSLEFTVNNNDYTISVKRTGATTKVALVENGTDISDHKVLDTYKKIQSILGLDFEIFSQLTYQSSVDLLDFLKATDTNRKKFLINLFNLEKYVNIGETIKIKYNTIDREAMKTSGEMKSIDDFLNNVSIPQKQNEQPLPDLDESLQQEVGILNEKLRNHEQICKKIDQNNLYISERDNLSFRVDLEKPESFKDMDQLEKLKQTLVVYQNEIKTMKKELSSIDDRDNCPMCGQKIDNKKALSLKVDLQNKLYQTESRESMCTDKINILNDELRKSQSAQRVYEQNLRMIERFEQLTQLIDPSIPSEHPDAQQIRSSRKMLLEKYQNQKIKYDQVVNFNKQVGVNNAKIEALEEQKENFLNRQTLVKNDKIKLTKSLNNLNILKKAFSTSGIVAFKLENLTKELQDAINHYLSLLSDGQFQIRFTLDKEKLNIVVINNGEATPIETVSGGEFSRIQTAILLAIRNLLSKLGGSSVNLLFLDEITGVLDDEGKEKLIEVLRSENDLNVFLISHDFTHPLVDKIHINKDKNISSVRS
jgi:DNA repair exonuclease SbcCD ATPase subunit